MSEPWEAFPTIWKNKTAFFTYLRGGLRRLWSTYPAKLAWKKAQMVVPGPAYTGRAKTLGECYYCRQQFAASHLEVDHVFQAGSCYDWETASEFLEKLLDCNNNWVLSCKPCHRVKSYAERMGVSFTEAVAEKKAIEYSKKGTKLVVAFCVSMGYNAGSLRNSEQRRKALVEIFSKGE